MSRVSRRALSRYAADQLQAGASAKTIASHLAAQIIESGHADQLEFLVGDIAWELEQRGELSISRAISAHPLSAQLKIQLKVQIKKATGTKDVLLEEQIDKSVIGGIRVETPGRVWDSTLVRQLANLKEAF
jgi:F-type H+-transporting ATPase subunit delta